MLPGDVLAKALVNANDSHLSPTPFTPHLSPTPFTLNMASWGINQMNEDIWLKWNHPRGLMAISYAILISLILSCDIFP